MSDYRDIWDKDVLALVSLEEDTIIVMFNQEDIFYLGEEDVYEQEQDLFEVL